MGCGNFDGQCPNPTFVNVRDRVTAEEVQRVLFNNTLVTRDLRRAPNTPTNPGWAALFDCDKDTCIVSPISSNGREFHAGESFLFVFEDELQIETVELERKVPINAVSFDQVPMLQDIMGHWVVFLSDGTTLSTAGAVAEFPVGAKVAALYFEFDVDTPDVCAATFKKFSHVVTRPQAGAVTTVQPEPAASFEDSVTAGAADVIVDFPAETVGVQLANDSPAASVLFTFRQTNEAAAPATGAALRTLTLLAGEKKSYDNFRVLGLKHKRAGAVSAAIRISAW